jgi:sensor histidine kinase regulating citrate/malate metabolism
MIVSVPGPPVSVLSAVKVEFIVVARARRTTLAGQLLVLQLAVVLVVLVLVGGLSVAQSEATFTRVEGRRVSALAEQLGANPLVRTAFLTPETRTALAVLGQSVVTQSRVSTVTFADADERVRVSTDPSLDDTRLPLPRQAVADGASWSGTLEVGGRRQLVSQVPVFDTAPGRVGQHLGTVMIGEDVPSVWQRLRGASSYLLTYLGTALAVGLLGSWLLARRIKRQTLGMEPEEITGLVEHREALLYGIAEGVIALDPAKRITLVNDVARRLLDLPEHAIGMSLDDLRIKGRLYAVLSGEATRVPSGGGDTEADGGLNARDGGARPELADEVVVRRGRVLVMNRMEVEKDGRHLGTVTTLRDRTALADLERQLGSFRSSTQLLRAQGHEFANQLHTISGLIQIGEYDEVVRYVDAVSQRRQSLDLSVNSRVRDPAVGVLLMAKASVAAERRVDLRISDDTHLDRLQPEDSADVATVVGNLVDNAIDAAAGRPEAWVEVELTHDTSTVRIMVRDNGSGVPDDVAATLFDQGVTTKTTGADEHGIGLALTRLVCRRRGGEAEFHNTSEGAVFTAHLTVAPVPEAVAR